MKYGKKTLIALDQLVNALVGGWPDETLATATSSPAAGKRRSRTPDI
ncbi:hypothetical protein [Bilophila wadsworthia]